MGMRKQFLSEIIQFANRNDDPMNDHLLTLFQESLAMNPKLIVELGVGVVGTSTFVLSRVARLTGGRLVSVDIRPGWEVCADPGWIFVHQDDVQFGKEFPQWCVSWGLSPQIDVLYIDTSHLYEHTAQEISVWFPHLNGRAKVFFHDSNLQDTYTRRNGNIIGGWNNKRGVIRALEDFFGKSFHETVNFSDFVNGWSIRHDSISCGFTILER